MIALAAALTLLLAAEPDPKSRAREVVKATGCTRPSQCHAIEMGSRPCGGPSEFLVYCSLSTDVKKLKTRVKAATDAEKALNATQDLMSICSVLAAPKVKLEKGVCVAEEAKPTDLPL